MSSFRSFPIFLLCAATLARGQTPSAPPSPAGDKVERLDRFVVSAGPDPKTSFDLAQGTTVLAGEELRRLAQATLGETLASTPGVAATSYGPGASRPIIRGLGGDRVRVLDNGVGALDASNVSPDHNAALEPLFASSIEVLRGPSTLLYGSSAVGGVVNVIGNSIPLQPLERSPAGAIEVRAGGAGRERTGVFSAEAGTRGFGFHVNALKQTTGDLRIPDVARVDPEAPADQPRGTLPGSATDTWSGSLGASGFWAGGRLGAALSNYETEYGVPTGDDPPISIRMRQTRLELSSEITTPFGPFRGARLRAGLGDYEHSELGGGTTVNTTFENKAWEGRLELPHAALGALNGTLGVQASRSDFSAMGEEVVTPHSVTTSGALFALEELKLGETLTLQFGGRAEGQAIELREVSADLPVIPGYGARSGQKKKFAGASASAGLVLRPAADWSIGAALAYTTRLPTAQELFSNGPHGGTGAYEVGSTSLGDERSLGLDLSVRRRAGVLTGTVSAFVNRFDDYIFQQELPAAAIPAENNPDGLTPFQYQATDATFYGGEAEVAFHLLHEEDRNLHLVLSSDYVRAERGGEPLPRIPPLRYGARLEYEDSRWNALLELRRAEPVDRLAPDETPTPGHTLLNASVAYLIPTQRVSYELFVRGRNLADATAREHSSFLKDLAPLPGRSVLAGVRMSF